MNTTTNQTTAVSSTPQAHHSGQRLSPRTTLYRPPGTSLKTLRKMGRFDDNEMLDDRRVRRISSADETLDD